MINSNRNRLPSRLAILLAASPALLWSQGSPVGNVGGTLVSQEDKPLAGIRIQVHTARGDHQIRTDDLGRFFIPMLPPGKVRVVAQAQGMSEINVIAMIVVNQTTTLNLKMQRSASAIVEVVDAASLVEIDPNQAKAGKYQSMDVIAEMPLVDLNRVNSVVNRTAGVVPGSFSFNGVSASYNAVNIDGVDVRSGNGGQQAAELNNYFIDQIQVLTNGISAKYGTFAGGVINVTTKNGTNTFAGTADYDISNPKWNALPKLSVVQRELWRQTVSKPVDQHVTVQSYTFTGPIIKDKLFFAWSLRNQTPTAETHRVTSAPYFSGIPYKEYSRNYRMDAKLDWQINTSNNVYADWNQSVTKNVNPTGSSTAMYSTAATLPGTSKSVNGYVSAGWMSILSSSLFMDLKFSQTMTTLGGAGTGPLGGSAYTWVNSNWQENNMLLDNGFGSSLKQEDKTRSGALNFTWMGEALGRHTVEFGVQTTRFVKTGGGGYTPSNVRVWFDGFNTTPPPSMDLAYRQLAAMNPMKTSLSVYDPIRGEASTTSVGFYVNDYWVLDSHWSLNLGLRDDRFRYASSPEGIGVSYGRLDPRFSVNYDLQGNGKHVVSLSASIYSAMPLISNFSSASVATSPIQHTYVYIGTGGSNQGNGTDGFTSAGAINWAAWGNLEGQTGQGSPYYTSDPLKNRNVGIDQHVQAPNSKELHLSYRYQGQGRNASVSLLRRWTTDQICSFGKGNAETGVAQYTLTNNPDGREDYYALLLTGEMKLIENLILGANLTWSRNFSNLGTSIGANPGQFNGNVPSEMINPYGPSPNCDMPLYINADARYRLHLGSGDLNLGLISTYTGSSSTGFRSAWAYVDSSLVDQGYDYGFNRQFPNLGPVWQPSFLKFDLQVGYEQTVWKTVKAYAKVNILNIFNDRKVQGTYQSGQLADPSGDNYPANGAASNISYSPDPIYEGAPSSHREGRGLRLTLGARF